MNERDYILATNCARLQMAVHAMESVLVTDEDSYGLKPAMLRLVKADLSRLQDMAFRATEGT